MSILDYSNWRPSSPQALVAAGVTGVVAYIKPARFNWPKAIKVGELQGLLAAGIAVAFNYENNPDDWTGGWSAGVSNGTEAKEALGELGLPLGTPVYVSYDQDIRPDQFGAAAEYHRGFRYGSGRELGIYGEGALIEFLGTRFGWESESTSFPGKASPTPHTVLVQHYGQQLPGLPGQYDVNSLVQADWGQYPSPVVTPPVVVTKPIAAQTGGLTHDMANAKSQLITTASLGFGQFVGIFDAGAPVAFAQATVQGPDPHQSDPSSKDDLWPTSIGATARVNIRGNKVIVTVDAPNEKGSAAGPNIYCTAVLA